MEQAAERHCAACGGELGFIMQTQLAGRQVDRILMTETVWMSVYQCKACQRYEFFPPSPLDGQSGYDAQEEADRTWLREFQEKVKAGLITAAPFVCPQCGNMRRDRVCSHCGCVMDLKTMTVVGGDEGRGRNRRGEKKPDWEL